MYAKGKEYNYTSLNRIQEHYKSYPQRIAIQENKPNDAHSHKAHPTLAAEHFRVVGGREDLAAPRFPGQDLVEP